MAVTKSELIDQITEKQLQLSAKDVELAVKTIVEEMSKTLSNGGRIEIRGFGSFSLHYRESRTGRNPKTGDAVRLSGKHVPHFKPGKELRERVNNSRLTHPQLTMSDNDDEPENSDHSSNPNSNPGMF